MRQGRAVAIKRHFGRSLPDTVPTGSATAPVHLHCRKEKAVFSATGLRKPEDKTKTWSLFGG